MPPVNAVHNKTIQQRSQQNRENHDVHVAVDRRGKCFHSGPVNACNQNECEANEANQTGFTQNPDVDTMDLLKEPIP